MDEATGGSGRHQRPAGPRRRGGSRTAGGGRPAASDLPPAFDVADPGLADVGAARIEWAQRGMPVLGSITRRFAEQRPLGGLTVAACLHVTAETAVFLRALRAGGARVSLAASNPLSTQDEVAAALAVADKVAVYARAGVDRDTYYRHIRQALDTWTGSGDLTAGDGPDAEPAVPTGSVTEAPTGTVRHHGAAGRDTAPSASVPAGPDLVVDDGCDLTGTLHTQRPWLLHRVWGGCESTTTGVIRLRRMAADGALAFPVIAANDTASKRLMDNTCGTGQSVIDGILRATNTLLAGRTVVVAGFGACGKGVAERARGLGADVIVTEIDPVRALEAVLRGFRVLPMAEAARIGHVFVTATGSTEVITAGHLTAMPDGAILANAGHFDVEIDVRALAAAAVAVHREVRPHVDCFELADGRRLLLLAEGRVVNLVAAEGHPAQVMDLSFGVQALALEWLAGIRGKLAADVHEVPAAIDAEVARLELAAIGTRLDVPSPAQLAYRRSWRSGS